MEGQQRRWFSRRKKIIFGAIALTLAVLLLAPYPLAGVIYEGIFHRRFEPDPWYSFSYEEFEGLSARRSEFESSEGESLVGYCYIFEGVDVTARAVFAHGMGSGGHTPYLPLIAALAREGFAVFAYDATGNGESGGASNRGLPQGPSDLLSAVRCFSEQEELSSLPLYLIGHSWGAYSVGCVLSELPEVEGAVLLSGFDSSVDLMCYDASQYVGSLAVSLTRPALALYDGLKFGEDSRRRVVDSLGETDARVLTVHSSDDEDVPASLGYDRFYEAFCDDSRFEFLLYSDRGHGYVYCSPASAEARDALEASRISYEDELGRELREEELLEFYNENGDRHACFEADGALVERMVSFLTAEGPT